VTCGCEPPWVYRKRDHTAAESRVIAQAVLDALPPCDVTCFSDGAARDGAVEGGAGFAVYVDGKLHHEGSGPAGLFCSSTQAEAVGIGDSLDFVASPDSNLPAGFTSVLGVLDSQPMLYRFAKGPLRCDDMESVRHWSAIYRLPPSVALLILQFTPSHVDIEGNERADRRAADGAKASMAAQLHVAVPLSTAKARVIRAFRSDWLVSTDNKHPHALLIRVGASSLTDSHGNPRAGVVPAASDPARADGMRPPKHAGFAPLGHSDLTRAGEVMIARLTTRHHRLLLADGWVESRGRLTVSTCPDCDEPRSLLHLLGGCARFPAEWRSLFDGRPPGWLADREPHLVIEYLCARGWVEQTRGELLSKSYLKIAPLPPPTASPASPPPSLPPERPPGSCSDSDDSIEAVLIL